VLLATAAPRAYRCTEHRPRHPHGRGGDPPAARPPVGVDVPGRRDRRAAEQFWRRLRRGCAAVPPRVSGHISSESEAETRTPQASSPKRGETSRGAAAAETEPPPHTSSAVLVPNTNKGSASRVHPRFHANAHVSPLTRVYLTRAGSRYVVFRVGALHHRASRLVSLEPGSERAVSTGRGHPTAAREEASPD
jgi:hypothetical protein